jgi:hypothetical protein
LVFARLKTKTRKLMQLAGLEDRIGAANFFLRVEDAAEDHIARMAVS